MTDLVNWLALGVAVGAFGVSGLALRWARRSAIAAEDSAAAARDAAAAARDDADVSLRAEQTQLAEREEAAVTWEISWPGTVLIFLRNTGEQTAYHLVVSLSPRSANGEPVRVKTDPTVYPGGGVRVDVRHHKMPGCWVEVSWRLQDDLAVPVRTRRFGIGVR